MIRLVDVDESNWRIPLAVAPGQERYVANSAVLLACAYAYRNLNSRAFLIYADDVAVGMGLYYDCPEMAAYDLSQIFIDARYQGRGYGREATELVLDAMCQAARYEKVALCYIKGNEAARRLYESFGFVETDRDEDEIVMERAL